MIDDLPLFAAQQTAAPEPITQKSEVEARLNAVLPDALTPKDALDLIYELKAMLDR